MLFLSPHIITTLYLLYDEVGRDIIFLEIFISFSAITRLYIISTIQRLKGTLRYVHATGGERGGEGVRERKERGGGKRENINCYSQNLHKSHTHTYAQYM